MTLTNTVAHKAILSAGHPGQVITGLQSLLSQPSISVLRIIASSVYRPS